MAHPTCKFFGVHISGEYKLIPCSWRNYPRPEDLEGSHPYYDDPNKMTIFFNQDVDLDLVGANYDKVTLETWTAPDCIFEKKQYGAWYNFGHRVLCNVTFIECKLVKGDSIDHFENRYRFEKLTHFTHHEYIQLPVDHIPDDPDERIKLKWLRPRVTAEDIIAYRGYDLDAIKPDIVVGK